MVPLRREDPDLAPLLTMVLAGDRALLGPSAARILDPVPPDDLVRAVIAGIPGLMTDLADDIRNVLLTLARIWTTVETGSIGSKDDAADWALARLPPEHKAVLEHARDSYREGDFRSFDGLRAEVRPHVDHVVARIRDAAALRQR